MLIATLPSTSRMPLLRRMLMHPAIGGVRFNVGMRVPGDARETLTTLREVVREAGKPFWLDLKGRQLRITRWADPTYGDIEVNREVELDGPATIYFRGGEWSTVVEARGRRLFVDPDPRTALGAGQAVVLVGPGVRLPGPYLTALDREYLTVAQELGIDDLMLSFIESGDDVAEVRALNPRARCVLKIESPAGLALVEQGWPGPWSVDCRLMAARDDLLTTIGDNKAAMLPALALLARRDPHAIVASHLFNSVRAGETPTIADLSDARLMWHLGYRHFLLSDGVSHQAFDRAVAAWQGLLEVFPEMAAG